MRIRIWPYKMGSKSARFLARGLGTLRVHGNSPTYRPKRSHLVINWGNSDEALWHINGRFQLLNHPHAVECASNKLETFQYLSESGVSVPAFTTNKQEAEQWITEGKMVYCRKHLRGHSGSGIVVAESAEQLVNAPLYTQRVKAKYEYRVHVVQGNIIDFSKKKKREGVEANHLIRNHGNGYVYAREGEVLPDSCKTEALAAVEALGLDFGAVDVLYLEREEQAYVLEVNSAPGLEGTTLQRYTEAFKQINRNLSLRGGRYATM